MQRRVVLEERREGRECEREREKRENGMLTSETAAGDV